MGKYSGKKALVLGLGISGQAAATYLLQEGATLIGVDKKASTMPLQPFPVVEECELAGIDFLVQSPGVPPTHPLIIEATRLGIEITSEMELGLRHLHGEGKRLFAITGANGKTTTTLLTTHILNTAGISAEALGNVGTPLLSRVHSQAEVFVVEVSSFQIETLSSALFSCGVILNITPNHLDRYSTFEDYVKAKLKLERHLKGEGTLYLHESVEHEFSTLLACQNHKVLPPAQENIESISFLGYRGCKTRIAAHDLDNIRAAYALCQAVGMDDEAFIRGASTFTKPPHRVEYVGEIGGVHFVNDSKATSVDAVSKGVASIPGTLILIAGGVDKGGAYSDWVPQLRGKVNKVFVIGQASQRIEKELSPVIPVERASDLKEAVIKAWASAAPGQTVLLSPGCSSYDQFENYQRRGDLFKQFVFELGEKL